MSERARLFVTAWLPGRVVDAIAALPRPDEPGVRYSRRDQWHVTMRFLGSCEVDEALAAFHTIDASATEAVVGPAVSRLGRSIVVVPVQGLDALAAEVVRATSDVGQPPDPRPFTGHITIARLRDRAACGVAGGRFVDRFPVDAVHLVRSDLRPDGAVYDTIATQRLR